MLSWRAGIRLLQWWSKEDFGRGGTWARLSQRETVGAGGELPSARGVYIKLSSV